MIVYGLHQAGIDNNFSLVVKRSECGARVAPAVGECAEITVTLSVHILLNA